jgi:hypothetical protein
MISHSIITLVWMLVALGVHFIGVSPFLMAASATGWWWSREQYWDELKLRKSAGGRFPTSFIPSSRSGGPSDATWT